jgi:hypothetical protein
MTSLIESSHPPPPPPISLEKMIDSDHRVYEFLADVFYERLLLRRYFQSLRANVLTSQRFRTFQPRLSTCLCIWQQYVKDSKSYNTLLLKAIRHWRLVVLSRAFSALHSSAIRSRTARQYEIYIKTKARTQILEKAFQVWIFSIATTKLERDRIKQAEIHYYSFHCKRVLYRWKYFTTIKQQEKNARMFAIKKILKTLFYSWKILTRKQIQKRLLIQSSYQMWNYRLLIRSLSIWRRHTTHFHTRRLQNNKASLYYTNHLLQSCLLKWKIVTRDAVSYSNRLVLFQTMRHKSLAKLGLFNWLEYTRKRIKDRVEEKEINDYTFQSLRIPRLRRILITWRIKHKKHMNLAMIEATIRFKNQNILLEKCLRAIQTYCKWQQTKREHYNVAQRFNSIRLKFAAWCQWRFAFTRHLAIERIGSKVEERHSFFVKKKFFSLWKRQVVRKRLLADVFLIGVKARSLGQDSFTATATFTNQKQFVNEQDKVSYDDDTEELDKWRMSHQQQLNLLDPFLLVQNALQNAEMNNVCSSYQTSNVQSTFLASSLSSSHITPVYSPNGGEPKQTVKRILSPPRPLRFDNLEQVFSNSKFTSNTISISTAATKNIDKLEIKIDKHSHESFNAKEILDYANNKHTFGEPIAVQHTTGSIEVKDTNEQENKSIKSTDTNEQENKSIKSTLDSESIHTLHVQIEALTSLIKIRQSFPSLCHESISLVNLLQEAKEKLSKYQC